MQGSNLRPDVWLCASHVGAEEDMRGREEDRVEVTYIPGGGRE